MRENGIKEMEVFEAEEKPDQNISFVDILMKLD